MARRILVGELREKVAEAALACHSFLITGRAEYLEPLRSADRSVNGTAEDEFRRHEVARMREAGAKWQREVSRARLLALAASHG